MIKIKSFDGGEFDAYIALPASGYGPGIVVLQEIFGVNEFLRGIADWYAAHGFVAICPDLFWRQEPSIELTDQSEAEWQKAFQLYQGLDVAKAVEDSGASVEFLRQHAASNGRVGAVGFCLGGNLAWLLSVRYKADCAVGYYGVGIEKTLSEVDGLTSPLMLHIAGCDDHCPPEAQKQIHDTLDSNPLVTIYDYPNSEHAFGRPGKHYDAAAAELAHLRSLEFFARCLAGEGFANAQKLLSDKWDEHVKYEFATRDTEDTLKTMVADAYVNHVPVLTGGVGHDQLREFYSQRFIPQMPPDTSMTPVSRTIGTDRVVDEMVFEFTHTIKMDWMLPGVEPTNKHVKVPLIVVVHFRAGKLAHEHIYWDQASVLAQLGLIDASALPIAGVETAEKVLNPKLPANELMKR
jgi:carboxymethylenebutenolidase